MMGIETMKNVSPKTVDRSTLVQRSSVRLDPAAPREDRLREFIKQIRNPYCFHISNYRQLANAAFAPSVRIIFKSAVTVSSSPAIFVRS